MCLQGTSILSILIQVQEGIFQISLNNYHFLWSSRPKIRLFLCSFTTKLKYITFVFVKFMSELTLNACVLCP